MYVYLIYLHPRGIVEIWTQKSINFANFKRKKNPERLFPLQNVFCFTLPNASESFFEGLFPFQNVRRVPSGPKIDLCWVWFGLKNYPLVNKQKAIEHGHL